jgi:hypothetical protein
MRRSHPKDPSHARLLPAGRRWGFGAHSVVPYLTQSQHARPAEAAQVEEAIRNPVFPQMEPTLRALRRHT